MVWVHPNPTPSRENLWAMQEENELFELLRFKSGVALVLIKGVSNIRFQYRIVLKDNERNVVSESDTI